MQHLQVPQQHSSQNPHYPSQPSAPQRYVYVNSGSQPYINPAFIPQNQNYYTSPVIQNPPVPNSYSGNDPYANYYNYYQNYYQNGCGCNTGYGQGYPYYGGQYQGYGQYNCQPCAGYQQQYAQGNCGCNNCAEYGLPFINRQRITPKFPSKLGHSYVTSGDQVQNKLVINEPTHESAPFQTQRRKTYQPYTRKYIEYQDYIQYVPVQKSQWIYKKVMKQIDFVPQQYYETHVQTVPRERLDYKVREFVHVPKDVLNPSQPPIQHSGIRQVGQQVFRSSLQTIDQNSVVRPDGRFTQSTSNIPLHSSKIIRASNPPVDSNKVLHTIYQQNSPTPIIRPAQSTVEMVSNARLQPFNADSSQRSGTFGGLNQQTGYQFPSSGGVMIGGSSQTNLHRENPILSSFGPGNEFPGQNQTKTGVNIEASEVIHSGYGTQNFGQNKNVVRTETHKEVQYSRNFRESGHVESQDFNFDPTEIYKKQSFVNRFEEDSN